MANKFEDDMMYMDFARRAAERSYDLTHQVGCVVVRDEAVISTGWNGMPAGMDNRMEFPSMVRHECGSLYLRMRTRPEVQHAELNALGKLAASTMSAAGASLYVTLSPCLQCALFIHRARIAEVIYDQQYKDLSGIHFLTDRELTVRRIK